MWFRARSNVHVSENQERSKEGNSQLCPWYCILPCQVNWKIWGKRVFPLKIQFLLNQTGSIPMTLSMGGKILPGLDCPFHTPMLHTPHSGMIMQGVAFWARDRPGPSKAMKIRHGVSTMRGISIVRLYTSSYSTMESPCSTYSENILTSE